jgi:hypothetical protein
MTVRLTVLSLGAGVQSTTMALMAARGEIKPMPDCAIFADTGWEPRAVYEHFDRLEPLLPFPVHRVSAGNIRSDMIAKVNATGQRFAAIPFFTLSKTGQRGMARRQCTKEYKLEPIRRLVVEMMGGRPKGGCEVWLGISTDEAIRMKPSRVRYMTSRWPLIEADMSRRDCERWLLAQGMSAPKSACIGCPFRSNEAWRSLKPEEFADAVEVDAAIRHPWGMRSQAFLHRDRVPLDKADLRTHAERGQPDLFGNECEGMCGV